MSAQRLFGGWGLSSLPRVAVIPLEGLLRERQAAKRLGGVCSAATAEQLEKALESRPQAIVLHINCPGGSPYQAESVAQAVAALPPDAPPVVSFVADYATSGGYWLA